MSAQYHIERETLAEYALGALAPGMEILVASHLTFCPSCRRAAESYETMGGAMLEDGPVSSETPPSLEATLAMLDADEDPIVRAPREGSLFPAALRQLVPADHEKIDWTFRLPGIYEYELAGFGHETVSLLKAKPGAKMLAHTHDGEESTLILSGQMKDGHHVYAKGDVANADHDHDHRPEIIGTETCVCLIVMSGKMKFTGTIGRALNVLMR